MIFLFTGCIIYIGNLVELRILQVGLLQRFHKFGARILKIEFYYLVKVKAGHEIQV